MDVISAREAIAELIVGHEIAIESEIAVVNALEPYFDAWQTATRDTVTTELTRRVRQRQGSQSSIRQWTKELEAFRVALEALNQMAQTTGDQHQSSEA